MFSCDILFTGSLLLAFVFCCFLELICDSTVMWCACKLYSHVAQGLVCCNVELQAILISVLQQCMLLQEKKNFSLLGLSSFIPYSKPLLEHLFIELPGSFFSGLCFLLSIYKTSTLGCIQLLDGSKIISPCLGLKWCLRSKMLLREHCLWGNVTPVLQESSAFLSLISGEWLCGKQKVAGAGFKLQTWELGYFVPNHAMP